MTMNDDHDNIPRFNPATVHLLGQVQSVRTTPGLPPFDTQSVVNRRARRANLSRNGVSKHTWNIIPRNEVAEKIFSFATAVMNPIFKADEDVTMVPILNGGLRFYSELASHIHEGSTEELMAVPAHSYGLAKRPGEVIIGESMLIPSKIMGRTIFLIDDIYDSGTTVSEVAKVIQKFEPKRIITVFLLRKQGAQTAYFTPDYCLFEIDRESWAFGFGMDLAEKYRHLPFVCDDNENLYDRSGAPRREGDAR
jgi:hypoxanthine phosphoribosyltransferase